MGQVQNNLCQATSQGQWPVRRCFRKDCGNRFRPNCWNQRYCQHPHCLREVRRWYAAKRQRKRRASAEHRQQHAQAERQRRIQKKQQAASRDPSSQENAATAEQERRAWSRSKNFHEDFCDRPGCYEPRRTSFRAPAKYCGDQCRRAVRRVLDRERKWKRRNTSVGRYGRRLENAQHTRKTAAGSSPDDSQQRQQTGGTSGANGGEPLRGRRLFAVF